MNNIALMARFNAWANDRLYGCVAGLSEAAYRKDRKAYFGSIHNTLNHLLVVDRLWTCRMLTAHNQLIDVLILAPQIILIALCAP